MDAAYEQFIDRLIEERGFADVDATVAADLKHDLLAQLEARINAAVLERLPPSRLAEFEGLLATEDAGAVRNFCKENVPDLDALVAGVLERFRKAYLGLQ